MKFKTFAFMLIFAITSWAQSATQSAPAPSTSTETNAACGCCEKMASQKSDKGCCHHSKNEAKQMAQCSGMSATACCGKAMQCGKADPNDKTASCCKDKSCCGEGNSCCGSGKEGATTAMSCCKGKQCGMHHESVEQGEMKN